MNKTPIKHCDTPNKRTRTDSSPEILINSRKKQRDDLEPKIMGELSTANQQLLESFTKILESKMCTKEDFSSYVSSLNNLISGLTETKREVIGLRHENKILKEKVESLEIQARKNNLIFMGLPAHASTEDSVRDLCKNVLGIERTDMMMISKAFRLGKKEVHKNGGPVLVEFVQNSSIGEIFRNVRKLKGSGITIQRDYPEAIRKKRNKLLAVRREIIKLLPNEKVVLKDYTLFVKDKKFLWDETDGLQEVDKGGLDILRNIAGLDIGNLVNRLLTDAAQPNKKGGYQVNPSENKQI